MIYAHPILTKVWEFICNDLNLLYKKKPEQAAEAYSFTVTPDTDPREAQRKLDKMEKIFNAHMECMGAGKPVKQVRAEHLDDVLGHDGFEND